MGTHAQYLRPSVFKSFSRIRHFLNHAQNRVRVSIGGSHDL